jgi:hypothetical protein
MPLHEVRVCLFPMAWHSGTRSSPWWAARNPNPSLANPSTYPGIRGEASSWRPRLDGDLLHQRDQGDTKIGYSIDWRKLFTTIVPTTLIHWWQFAKLRQKDTSREPPVGWCPHCGNPSGSMTALGIRARDRFHLIKFRKGDTVFRGNATP